MAIDGGWIAVGAPSEAGEGGASGAVYAFARDGNDWTCRQRLLAPQQGGSDPPANFGDSVAIDGDALAAGATGRADHGTVNLFGRQADGSWLAEAVLAAGDGRFGFAVDIDDGSILAGAPTDGAMGEQSGAAFLFDTAHPGDADHDGDVDESDAQAVRLHFEMPGWASWQDGDFDSDADVDASDYATLKRNWGWTGSTPAWLSAPPGEAPADGGEPAVPEPASLAILGAQLTAMYLALGHICPGRLWARYARGARGPS